ncbi:YqgE/AlgH family protein [Craterilacuibacter sp.]|uniref:YqgE/AlgH family protein n=1 Tax=Craterilacuibacter sp. TaxID=2870909 RepID=UPI003F3E99E3
MSDLTLSNHFLIAMPNMADPLFAKSLLYLCDHGEHGAMGIIINKPAGISMGKLFSQIGLVLEDGPVADAPVLFGGPVQPERGFVLHTPLGDWQSTLHINDTLALTTSRDVLQAVSGGQGPGRLLLSLGYAGWEAGQLEQEITQNAWLTVEADPEIIFALPPEKRYAAAIALLGFDPALLSGDVGHA